MLYIVAYDVPNDRVRSRLADVLSKYGERIQYSVFEIHLEPLAVASFKRDVSDVLRRGTRGECRAYRICPTCHDASFAIGAVSVARSSAGWFLS